MQMMSMDRNVSAILAAGILAAALSGCQKEEGPAERAGKAMDKAVENAGQQIEKAGEKIQDAARDAKK
jgi:hypothetical protein